MNRLAWREALRALLVDGKKSVTVEVSDLIQIRNAPIGYIVEAEGFGELEFTDFDQAVDWFLSLMGP